MKILLTGCAGFIGSHTTEMLLERGDIVIGVDELNDYYDVNNKKDNLKILKEHKEFRFYKEDIRNYPGALRNHRRDRDTACHAQAAQTRSLRRRPKYRQKVIAIHSRDEIQADAFWANRLA